MFPFTALSVTTNLLKHPKRTLGISHKAAPTVQVSLSNANAQRDSATAPAVSHSCIPFPSQPIECARVCREEDNFDSLLAYDAWTVGSPPSVTESWSLDICRKRAESSVEPPPSLRRSICSKDSYEVYMDDDGPQASTLVAGPRKRKMAVRRMKILAASKPAKRQKKSRAVRRQIADLQFTAVLHRSIVAHLRNLAFSESSSPPLHTDSSRAETIVFRIQDQLLAERLWKSLADRGITPLPLSPRPASAFISDSDLFSLKAERVDHIFQTEPLNQQDVLGSPVASSVYTLATRTGDAFMDWIGAKALSPSSTVSSTTPYSMNSAPSAEVLALPQLVASLILRHRDRSATRPRSSPYPSEHRPARRSPLSSMTRAASVHGRT